MCVCVCVCVCVRFGFVCMSFPLVYGSLVWVWLCQFLSSLIYFKYVEFGIKRFFHSLNMALLHLINSYNLLFVKSLKMYKLLNSFDTYHFS